MRTWAWLHWGGGRAEKGKLKKKPAWPCDVGCVSGSVQFDGHDILFGEPSFDGGASLKENKTFSFFMY